MNKLSNEENFKNYKKRKILRWLIMLCASLTIIFVILYYATEGYKTGNYTFVFIALVFFILNVILNKIRDNTKINLNEDNKKDKKEVKNIENKKKTTKNKKTK